MGYTMHVDGDRVARAAQQLTAVGEELESAGEALARALRVAAGASGTGALARAAESVAVEWGTGMGEMAEHGRQLGRATALAAEAYRTVEAANAAALGQRTAPAGMP